MRLARVAVTLSLVLGAAAVRGQDLSDIEMRGGLLRVLAVCSDEQTFFVSREPLAGFDWELLQGFARLHKLNLELVPVTGWDALIPALTQGRGDVIAGGFTDTAARRRHIQFTVETFPTRTVVLTWKPTPPVLTLEDLKAEKVGTLRGSFMHDDLVAAGIPASRIEESIEAGGIAEALRAGAITAGADGIEAALVARAKFPELRIGMFLGRPASLAYGIRKEDVRLRAALDEYVTNVRRTATWSRLAMKYFGETAPEILKKARGD